MVHMGPTKTRSVEDGMNRSDGRILTTHTGSLPRPLSLVKLLWAKDDHKPYDPNELDQEIRSSVGETVRRQVDAGLTVINDGEQGKTNFFVYRYQRLSGFEPAPPSAHGNPMASEAQDYPEFYKRWMAGGQLREGQSSQPDLCCTGPVGWQDFSDVERDVANLKAAVEGIDVADVFMSAISPATYAPPNHHYKSEEEYLFAMADAMSREYKAIVDAGFILQIDSPDLTTYYRMAHITVEEHIKHMNLCVDVINHAVRDLPLDRIRVHVCWGADEAPHNRDIPLKEIVHSLLRLKPVGMTIPGANGRHSHEWKVWQDVKLPEGKVIIPGVIDSTTNIIEHPEAVAERIVRYASVLGRENVIAGVDCGFDTVADMGQVDREIVWAKLGSLADGAALATKELWGKVSA
jgi:5-methyltetrahydropteroyltriglutamate--homocysteine methyltransferase